MKNLLKGWTKETLKSKLLMLLFCVIGNIIIGAGVALTKMAAFGNDPFNGSCFAVSAAFGIAYTTYTPCYNTVLFIFEILFGRKYIGPGTFINWFLICYAVDFFLKVFGTLFGTPEGFVLRLVFLLFGIVGCSLGIAIYQISDAGVAPYDVIPLMLNERFPKIPFFWWRVGLDTLSVASILIFHGEIGIGTVITAFGLGPIVQFFMNIIKRLFLKKKNPVPCNS